MSKQRQFDGRNGNGYQPLPVENSKSAGPPGSMAKSCLWTQVDDSWYETECEHAFEFYNGGPKGNEFAFCPYCGKKLSQGNTP